MSALITTVQRAGATAFIMFLTCGAIPAMIATTTTLGFDIINDRNLCGAWIAIGQLAAMRVLPRRPVNDAQKNVAKNEMPVPTFGVAKKQ